MNRIRIILCVCLLPAVCVAQVDDLQRAQQRQALLDLQARQTKIMQEQLDFQRSGAEEQQRARDDEMIRRNKAAVRNQQSQQAELDRELDRLTLEYLRERQRSQAAGSVQASASREQASQEPSIQANVNSNEDNRNVDHESYRQAVARSVAKAKSAYPFANEENADFSEFEAFVDLAAKNPEYEGVIRNSTSWPFIMATEFAARKGVTRKDDKKPGDQGQVFTAFNLDTGYRPPAAEIYKGRVFGPGEKMGGVVEGYQREVEPLSGGSVRVTDRPISK